MQTTRWNSLWWRRAWYVLSLILFPVFFLILALAGLPGWMFPVMAGTALVGYFIAGEALGRWPCPRCGLRFGHIRGTYRTMPLKRCCVHCGLCYGASAEEIEAPFDRKNDDL